MARKNSKKGSKDQEDKTIKRPWHDEPEDPNCKSSDVVFTAWIKCHVTADFKDNVNVSFGWLKESGECNAKADTGKDWVVEPGDGDDPENPSSYFLEFEKSTDAISCSPKFLRKFSEQTLSMTVTYPAPPPPPPADPEEPVETPEPLKAVITLPLAPLMMLTEETDDLEISDLICKEVSSDGIFSFQIGARIDKEMLSEEAAGALNPVLVSLEYAKDLPEEVHLKQKTESVFSSINFFGQKSASSAKKMTDGFINFQHHKCFFVGKWNQHLLREYLQTVQMDIEVHDRDGEQTEEQGTAIFPHGKATFSLVELLNPAITRQPLNMRADLCPTCRSTKERKGGTGTESLQAATLFSEEAKELLASMTTKEREYAPGHFQGHYVQSGDSGYYRGAYVEVQVKIARPLPLPDVIMKMEEANEKPKSPKGKKKTEEDDEDEEGIVDKRYERFGRVVLVLDYKKTTIVKKLLALITIHNTKVMNMESGPSRALATRQLTDQEKQDHTLDILTGFIVMDRTSRIILIEGLRAGALKDVVEAVGRPQKNHKKWKMLYHPECGFSERKYVDFDLCLKQIKLRQHSLEVLMQRPDLYDRSRTEEDVAITLECLMEMKRAERMHILKGNLSFPTAKNLLTIETQYGDFVDDLELEGGCVGDDSKTVGSGSKGSKGGRTSPTKSQGSKQSKESGSVSKKGASKDLDKTQLPNREDPDDDEADSDDEEKEVVKTQRISMKAATDAKNTAYLQFLEERKNQEPKDYRTMNKTHIKDGSEALATHREKNIKEADNEAVKMFRPGKVSGGYIPPNQRKQIDASFLDGMPVHIYSGQKLSTTELQKAHLRAKMKEDEKKTMWTYSPDYNSGCFPLVDDVEGMQGQLRQSVADETSYKHEEPWRYPKPRTVADYRKPLRDISESRKYELYNVPWQENEWNDFNLGKEGIIPGAFDAGTCGGGKNCIPVRRSGHGPSEEDAGGLGESRHATFGGLGEKEEEEPSKVTKKLEQPPMKFYPTKYKPDRPNIVDKYAKSIRDGEAQHHGLRFDKRRPDQWLQKMEDGSVFHKASGTYKEMLAKGTAQKYGKGKFGNETIEPLPSSYQHTEAFIEEPRTSDHPFQLAKDCSKSVAPMCPGVLGTKKHTIYVNSKRNPLSFEESQGRNYQRPPQKVQSAR